MIHEFQGDGGAGFGAVANRDIDDLPLEQGAADKPGHEGSVDRRFSGIGEVRQGKVIEIDLDETDATRAQAAVESMCEKLLANTVIENYAIRVEA